MLVVIGVVVNGVRSYVSQKSKIIWHFFKQPLFLQSDSPISKPMDPEPLKNLSFRDLQLQKSNQHNILKFTVLYEALLIQERGWSFLEKTRNEALDKLIVINKLLAEYHDPSAT